MHSVAAETGSRPLMVLAQLPAEGKENTQKTIADKGDTRET